MRGARAQLAPRHGPVAPSSVGRAVAVLRAGAEQNGLLPRTRLPMLGAGRARGAPLPLLCALFWSFGMRLERGRGGRGPLFIRAALRDLMLTLAPAGGAAGARAPHFIGLRSP